MAKKKNAWMVHLAATRKANPKLGVAAAAKKAKSSYKPAPKK